jgi:hypothetical protein
MDLKNYCLDLEKVNKISEKDIREQINNYYERMIMAKYIDKKDELSQNYFNTLYQGGFLIDLRDDKINKILS